MTEPDEVEIARQRLASLNPGDKEYFQAFNVFTNKLMAHSVRSRDLNGLKEVISRTQQLLDLAPPGHHFHAAALCIIGMAFIKRFKLLVDTNDVAQGLSYLEAAVEACTPKQSLYLPFVVNLSSGLLNRYSIFCDVKDLDRIVETTSTALSSSPQSPHRDSLLNNLAAALMERFKKLGNSSDLDTAIMHSQSSLDLRPPGHPLRYSALGNLAAAILLKFEVDGHLQDLESAASHYESALHLCSPGEQGLLCLTSLGIVYWHLYNLEGKIEKLETAIGFYQVAMEHSKFPNLDQSRLLDNYSAALLSRYSTFGDINDLDQAIHFLTTSSDILPMTYSGRPATLLTLGATLVTRFDATGNVADLDSSIEKLASALQLCTPGYHQRPVILVAYGNALFSRYIVSGGMQDLNLVVSTCKDALTLISSKGPNYSLAMASLTSTLLDCFDRLGDIEECQTIVDLCDRALVSTPPGAPIIVSLKINRARAFLQKFQLGGEEKDIGTSVAAFREVIPSIPEGHKEHVRAHLQLGISLEMRFKELSDEMDLDESIVLFRVAHRTCKRGKSLYIPVCMRLGNALRQRFEYHHDVDALDEGIVLLAEAEEALSPTPGHVEHKACLVNLGIALFMRFQAQRSRADLDTAIERVSLALTLPPSREEFLLLSALATLLSCRYSEDSDENLEDLERCIELFGVAAEQMPPKHPDRCLLCRNYGYALVKLGRRRDQLQHLNTAIAFLTTALELLPVSHYEQPQTHLNLADALLDRAKLLKNSNDLQNAIKVLRGMNQGLSEDSPMSHAFFHSAARLYFLMYLYSQQQSPFLMEEGFRCYETAARHTYANSFTSVAAALEWADSADKLQHSSALLAYQISLDFLYRHLLATARIESRHAALRHKRWVRQTGALATDATSCAVARGELALAVELSEQGRGLLWSQLSQSRTPLDALRSAGDTGRALASDFERVSIQLTWSAVAQDESRFTVTRSRLTMEEAARRYRQLSKELADIVGRIRQLEGFQSFLGRPSFESLQRAAVGGPVILVNVSRRRCDALILLHDAPPRLVPLPGTSLDEITTLSERFHRMLQTTTYIGQEKTREREVAVVLRTLWDTIVRPIVDDLTPSVPRGSRIWWCPTSKLTTLPLHAAGPYRKGAPNLPNIYVSSYTPTLAALVRARASVGCASSPPAFVAIGQANPAFASSTSPSLQTVSAELALVASLLPAPVGYRFSKLDGDASTADAALTALSTHSWAHIACHGHPNAERPFEASFALRDRGVTVLDVVRARGVGVGVGVGVGGGAGSGGPGGVEGTGPSGEFAFLSACHTAAMSRSTDAPDELIHLAVAMQFAGFRSVVGTMWAVDDGMVREVVRAFYESMFNPVGSEGTRDGPGVWDCTRAARALNRAAKMVDRDVVSLDQRIVFVHIGA